MKRRIRTYGLILTLLTAAALVSSAQEQPFRVERAPFSSRTYNEYSPVLLNGNIVFRSDKRLTVRTKNADNDGQTAMNIFIAQKQGEDEWSDPRLFANELQGKTEHYGPAVFNERGNRIWFNKINEDSPEKDAKIGIYSGGYAGGEWTGIQPFPYNNPDFNFMHPFLSEDGNMLFFSSDMRGGMGRFDIYVCHLRGTQWSEPVNLGPSVNTSRNEIYPVSYPDGRLYFSSNGLDPGIGGFDLYYTILEDGEWTEPVHLSPPFNTRRNDAWFYATNESYTEGYIHSNREGRINSIFEFSLDIPEDLYVNCKEVEKNSYCFTFYEAGTMDIDTTQYRYEWVVEGERFREKEVDYCFRGVGQYTIALNVIDLLSGEVLFNEATYDLEIENIEQVYINSPDTVYVNEPIRLSGTETFLKDFTIDRYIWSMGDYNWMADTAVVHRYFKPGTYTVELGVLNEADRQEEIQKTCGFKRIVVLPR